MNFKNIRNFAIIAHIDHGKSTIADRFIEGCGGVEKREMEAQILDSMPIEKERGITIKAQTVRLSYRSKKNNELYQLNLMDTPGHVDFAYEVNRSLAACEGSILVVDATQGVEAQTLANVYQAINNNHTIIIALNKIDLPAADPARVKTQIEDIIGLDTEDAILTSAKSGLGIDELLEAVIHLLPAPNIKPEATELKAMLIDSWYDPYLGIGVLARIVEGKLKKGMRIKFMATNAMYTIDQIGYFTPKRTLCEELSAGEIGFFTAAIKDTNHCKVGDTIILANNTHAEPLPGFKPNLPVVFCGLYPTDTSKYEQLKSALAKLHLNDSSFQYEPETSIALGIGFRCGFLGLLHLEIVQERLEREFDLEITTTAPSVIYKICLRDGTVLEIHNPIELPEQQKIDHMEEPWIKATIMVPTEYVSAVFSLCSSKRGIQLENNYIAEQHLLVYRLPLNEVIFDFYDKLKSSTRGYASFDWQMDGYEASDLVHLSILVNSEPADAFSIILHRSQAQMRGREICEALKAVIKPQLFQIAIQAAIGSRVIARETQQAIGKNVTAKCYGGDATRKRKLLEAQKEGKKRMRSIGKVEIPSSAYRAIFSMNNNSSS